MKRKAFLRKQRLGPFYCIHFCSGQTDNMHIADIFSITWRSTRYANNPWSNSPANDAKSHVFFFFSRPILVHKEFPTYIVPSRSPINTSGNRRPNFNVEVTNISRIRSDKSLSIKRAAMLRQSDIIMKTWWKVKGSSEFMLNSICQA